MKAELFKANSQPDSNIQIEGKNIASRLPPQIRWLRRFTSCWAALEERAWLVRERYFFNNTWESGGIFQILTARAVWRHFVRRHAKWRRCLRFTWLYLHEADTMELLWKGKDGSLTSGRGFPNARLVTCRSSKEHQHLNSVGECEGSS